MGFLSTLFGKKKKDIKPKNTFNDTITNQAVNHSNKMIKEFPSNNGLYPNELIMLFYAPQYKVSQAKFPDFWRTTYHIGFPKELLLKLEKEGYIRKSLPCESLSHMKVADLKKIAAEYDLKISGKKDDLISRISNNISDDNLSKFITDYYWALTEKGNQEVRENDYLNFLVETHPYSYMLDEIGLTIQKINELHHNNPDSNIRDLIWGELNQANVNAFQDAIQKVDFDHYCNILHVMAQFLGEEHRCNDTLNMFARYLFYRINFDAGSDCLKYLSYCKNNKEAADMFYCSANLAPRDASDVQQLANECGLSSADLKEFLNDAFNKEQDEGFFSAKDLATFVMYELCGDQSSAQSLCLKAVKNARSKMK